MESKTLSLGNKIDMFIQYALIKLRINRNAVLILFFKNQLYGSDFQCQMDPESDRGAGRGVASYYARARDIL